MKIAIALLVCLAPSALIAQDYNPDNPHIRFVNGSIRNISLLPGQTVHIPNNIRCVSFEVSADLPVNVKEDGCHMVRSVNHTVFSCAKANEVSISDIRPHHAVIDQSNDVEYQCKSILAP